MNANSASRHWYGVHALLHCTAPGAPCMPCGNMPSRTVHWPVHMPEYQQLSYVALCLQCRKLMIDMVIATDMAIHFDLLKNFNSQLEVKPDMNEWQERNLLYQMIVHLADIANPARPFPLARAWAERVIQEFCEQVRGAIRRRLHHGIFLIVWFTGCMLTIFCSRLVFQGDKEAAAGLAVSGFCNRANINMPRAQLNFIEIFVKVRQRTSCACCIWLCRRLDSKQYNIN